MIPLKRQAGRPRKDGTKSPVRYVKPMIQMDVADSVGGACANIASKSTQDIIMIRDWCNHLLEKRKERKP